MTIKSSCRLNGYRTISSEKAAEVRDEFASKLKLEVENLAFSEKLERMKCESQVLELQRTVEQQRVAQEEMREKTVDMLKQKDGEI